MPLLIGNNRKPLWPFVVDREHRLAYGLIRWWAGPPGGGRMYDIAGNTHLLLNGASFWGGGLDGGGAFRGDGASNYGDIGHFNATYPHTFACWVRLGSGDQSFMSFADSGPSGALSINYVSSTFRATSETSASSASATSGVTGSVDSWYFIVGQFLSTTSRSITVNGVKATNSSSLTALSLDHISVGALRFNSTTALYSTSIIDDPMVWNRALSDNEIWQLYDPSTRWSLRYQTRRKVWFVTAPEGQPAVKRMGGVKFAHRVGGAQGNMATQVW